MNFAYILKLALPRCNFRLARGELAPVTRSHDCGGVYGGEDERMSFAVWLPRFVRWDTGVDVTLGDPMLYFTTLGLAQLKNNMCRDLGLDSFVQIT